MVRPFVCANCRSRLLSTWQKQIEKRAPTPLRSAKCQPLVRQFQRNIAVAYVSRRQEFSRAPVDGSQDVERALEGSGRYSRGRLNPRELLKQLQTPIAAKAVSRKNEDKRNVQPGVHTRSKLQARIVEDDLGTAQLSVSDWAIFAKALNNHDYAAGWKILRDKARTGETSEDAAKRVGELDHAVIDSWLVDLTRATMEAWLVTLRGDKHFRDPALPTPEELLQRLHDLGRLRPKIWTELLWHISTGVHDMISHDGNSKIRGVERGVVRLVQLWKMSLLHQPRKSFATLSRIASSQQHASFTYPGALLSDPGAVRGRFFDLLKTTVKTSATDSAPMYDFASTVLVTLDVLGRMDQFHGPIPAGNVLQAQRLTRYLSTGLDSNGDDLTYEAAKAWAIDTNLEEVRRQREKVLELIELSNRSTRLQLKASRKQDVITPKFRHLDSSTASDRSRPSLQNDFSKQNELLHNNRHKQAAPDGKTAMMTSGVTGRRFNHDMFQNKTRNDVDHVMTDPSEEVEHALDMIAEQDEVMSNSSRARTQAMLAEMTKDGSIPPLDPRLERFVVVSITRLGRATVRQSLGQVRTVQAEIESYAERYGRAVPLVLFEHLMTALFAFGDLSGAMDVCNRLIAGGYTFTSKTYTILMRGASDIHNIDLFDRLWSQMRLVGPRPDAHAWSVRISGLIKNRRLQAGLQALMEMGQEWQIAAQKKALTEGMQSKRSTSTHKELMDKYRDDIDGCARPTLPVINSALAAVNSKEYSAITKIMAGAVGFGLEPDLTTYNILIGAAMRNDREDDAHVLLQRMESQGIEADGSTWVILLNALFRSHFIDGMSAEEQSEKILAVLDSFSHGPGDTKTLIGQKGYALTIDRLLKEFRNPTAAAAVLEHMHEHGERPQVQIYHILMSYYFDTHDLDAVKLLWQQIQESSSGYGDPLSPVFYNCMIEGYCLHHHQVGSEPAMTFLNIMKRDGMKPSWQALRSVIRMLDESGDREQLRRVVHDAMDRMQGTTQGTRLHRGVTEFWVDVISIGLLKEYGINSEAELLTSLARAPKAAPTLSS